MTDANGGDPLGTPAISVRVIRRGQLLLSEWCDSEEDVADAVQRWSQQRDVHCEVEDLATEPSTGGVSSTVREASP
jgi:hypothetical protein